MLGFAWLTLRQAQEALKNGRLEEAHRLLAQPGAQGQKGSWELLQKVARGFLERGERHLRQDNVTAAWNDLLQGEQVGTPDATANKLRQSLTRLGLAEVRTLLEAGEVGRAGEAVVLLRNRGVTGSEIQVLDEVTRGWNAAREQANKGQFAQAVQEVERIRKMWSGTLPALEEYYGEVRNRKDTFADLLVRMHQSMKREDWSEVLTLAEQALALAPQHEDARRARTKAWKAVEPATISAGPRRIEVVTQAAPVEPPQPRFLLWIDGVGGYLVCLGNKVTLGQATPDANVDIPLFADVSRQHATLTRDSEGYLLEGLRNIQVNGKKVEKALLQSGDRVTLGNSCQLLFRQPVPVSSTARLDVASGHRLNVAVEGVLLMAETLVLGPGTHVHVSMPDLAAPIILFRSREGIGIRHVGTFVVNGERCTDRGTLGQGGTATGDDFGIALEALGTRTGRA